MISAIILTWNSEKHIENCIHTLLADARRSKKELNVFVIDNGSKDRTLKILDQLRKKYFNIHAIKLSKNLGTTSSRNIAIRNSRSKYVFILDSDTEVQPNTLKILVDTIEKGKRIGIAAPRLLYPDGSVQHSCKRFPTAKIKLLKLLPWKKIKRLADIDELYNPVIYSKNFSQIVETDHCISAAWMLNSQAIRDVGLLDEKIFYAPEDIDYCLRMWLKGWKVVYNPKATVIHYTQRASYTKPLIAWRHIKGLIYFFRKYNYWINREKLYRKINRISS